MDEIYNIEPIDGYFAQEKLNGNPVTVTYMLRWFVIADFPL
jgi:hypothetical protein